MTRILSTTLAAAAILGATTGLSLAEGGGPGGKGSADAGTLSTQQVGGGTANSPYVTSNPDRMNTDREMTTAQMGDEAAARQTRDDQAKTSQMGPATYASH